MDTRSNAESTVSTPTISADSSVGTQCGQRAQTTDDRHGVVTGNQPVTTPPSNCVSTINQQEMPAVTLSAKREEFTLPAAITDAPADLGAAAAVPHTPASALTANEFLQRRKQRLDEQ